jgi:pimeloyl-ACP methyl ester carboxylesterase
MTMHNRRRFLQRAAAIGLAAGVQKLFAQSSKTIGTPILNMAYEETGPAQGFPIILLHGFPDDAHAVDDVAPPLAQAGYRVLVPYLRGYGATRFKDANAPRMAEQAAVGQDVIDFADALNLPRFALSGFDWGGRAAQVATVLHPDRVRCAVFCGGYLIQNTIDAAPPAPPAVEKELWYQSYFNTERGGQALQPIARRFANFCGRPGRPIGNLAMRPTTARHPLLIIRIS